MKDKNLTWLLARSGGERRREMRERDKEGGVVLFKMTVRCCYSTYFKRKYSFAVPVP